MALAGRLLLRNPRENGAFSRQGNPSESPMNKPRKNLNNVHRTMHGDEYRHELQHNVVECELYLLTRRRNHAQRQLRDFEVEIRGSPARSSCFKARKHISNSRHVGKPRHGSEDDLHGSEDDLHH